MIKTKPFRSAKYLKWVKDQPSAITDRPADDAHHIIGHNLGGMGTKPSDFLTFPLTREEHSELHNIGWGKWESIHGDQWKFVFRTLEKAIAEGVIKIG